MEGKALKINECSVLLLRGVTRYAFHVHTDSKGHQERPRERGEGGGGESTSEIICQRERSSLRKVVPCLR